MAQYEILKPCAYAVDGVAVVHTRAGVVVELDAAEARAAGDNVAPVAPDPVEGLAEWLAAEQAYNDDVTAWLVAEKKHAAKGAR